MLALSSKLKPPFETDLIQYDHHNHGILMSEAFWNRCNFGKKIISWFKVISLLLYMSCMNAFIMKMIYSEINILWNVFFRGRDDPSQRTRSRPHPKTVKSSLI